MVVCTVDDKTIGIEYIRPIDLMVAKRICTDKELINFFGPAPIGQDFAYTTGRKCLTRFFEPWTAKETHEK